MPVAAQHSMGATAVISILEELNALKLQYDALHCAIQERLQRVEQLASHAALFPDSARTQASLDYPAAIAAQHSDVAASAMPDGPESGLGPQLDAETSCSGHFQHDMHPASMAAAINTPLAGARTKACKRGLATDPQGVQAYSKSSDRQRPPQDLLQSRRRQTRLYRFLWGVILPEERSPWDMFLLLLLPWVVFAIPVIVCFGAGQGPLKGNWVASVDLCIDILFMLDIYLNFRTAHRDAHGQLVVEHHCIARRYASGWLWVDLTAVVPLDIVLHNTAGFVELMKVARVLRMVKLFQLLKICKLFRLIRFRHALSALEMLLDQGTLQIVAAIMGVLSIVHLAACLFYFMATEGAASGGPSWLQQQGLIGASMWRQYMTALYWAATTITTVGYGDIHPANPRERVVAMLFMAVGMSLLGLITSVIGNIMSIKNLATNQVAMKKQQVFNFLKARRVPGELALKLHSHYSYAASKQPIKDEEQLLAELPVRLRARVLHHLYGGMVASVPAFSGLPLAFLAQLSDQLVSEWYAKDELLLLQGDPGGTLYFLREGKLEVRVYEWDPVADPAGSRCHASHIDDLAAHMYTLHGVLNPPCYFGGFSCLSRHPWKATVVACEGSEVFSVTKERLQTLLFAWPKVAQALKARVLGASADRSQQERTPSMPQERGSKACSTANQAQEEQQCHGSLLQDFPTVQQVHPAEQEVAVNRMLQGAFHQTIRVANLLLAQTSIIGQHSTAQWRQPFEQTQQQELKPLRQSQPTAYGSAAPTFIDQNTTVLGSKQHTGPSA